MSNPFMQLYVADYLGDTRHLTTEQHGAYLLLLMTMWRADGALPNDDKKLARIVGCTSSRWARIKDEVLEFFDLEDGVLTNARLKLELKKASEKSNQRAEAGSRGGKAKALKTNRVAVANATDLLCHSSEPEPDTKEAKAPLVQRAKRKHVVPAGWAPNQAHVLKAQTLGLDLHEQAEAFREFEFDKPKADFDLAFHRWLRTARKFANDRPDRFTAKQSNYDAALVGSQWADQVLADRRTF